MRGHAKDTLLFIAIAVILMAVVDYFFMGGREAYRAFAPQESTTLSQSEPAPVYTPDPEPVLPPETEIDTGVKSDTVILPDDFGVFDFFNDELLWEERESRAVADDPSPVRTAPPMVREISSRPRIAIIIDDIGMNVRWSKAAVQLPGPLTMAVLPYAAQASHFADLSRANGHELLIHTPMEATNAPVSLGGMGLTTDMDTEDIVATMDKISATMNGYIGINNHMGSKFTADRAAMERLIPYLKEHNMIFVDSKTIGTSVAAMVADEQGIPYAVRDVFLDHEETPEFVDAAIRRLETIALRDGHAIAIGHPKATTITALQTWIPTLRDKGIDLVGISKLVLRPSAIAPALVPPAPVQSPVPQSLEQPSPY